MRTATAILAVFLAGMAPPRTAGAQESQIILFDKKYSDLRAEYRKPVELTFAYDRWVSPNSQRTIDGLFSIALIDLNDDDMFEVVIRVEHALHGIVPRVTVLIARKTEAGWRFIGDVHAPLFREHDTVPPILVGDTQFFVEEKKVQGWRVINDGPQFMYRHLSGETDDLGGWRYCWARTAPPPAYQYDKDVRMGLPFDSGGPGYFNIVESIKSCPKN